MGPRRFGRGDAVNFGTKHLGKAMLQWGRVLSDAVIATIAAEEAGTGTDLQWGRVLSDAVMYGSPPPS